MRDFTLIFGPGWLGARLAEALHGKVIRADITDRAAIESALKTFAPSVVINAAGKTGRPNIDGCEADPAGTLSVNSAGPILLAEECLRRSIFMAHLGSGCVYDGQRDWYHETDAPNFFGSIYSRSKIISESALINLPILQLRLRMPFDGTPHQRNLITKLAGYRKIINIQNSMTYVNDFVMAAGILIAARKVGVWNIVNPGAVTHSQIMDLYRKIVDPKHDFEVMDLEEFAKITKAGRSNCLLDTGKLNREGIHLMPVMDAVVEALTKYREKLR